MRTELGLAARKNPFSSWMVSSRPRRDLDCAAVIIGRETRAGGPSRQPVRQARGFPNSWQPIHAPAQRATAVEVEGRMAAQHMLQLLGNPRGAIGRLIHHHHHLIVINIALRGDVENHENQPDSHSRPLSSLHVRLFLDDARSDQSMVPPHMPYSVRPTARALPQGGGAGWLFFDPNYIALQVQSNASRLETPKCKCSSLKSIDHGKTRLRRGARVSSSAANKSRV
jgi:hypothetical protein